jgi:hypothetical protein
VVVSKHLNPGHVEDPPPSAPINDDSLWGVATSIKEVNLSLVEFELSLYCHKHVDDNDVKLPLQWWKDHPTIAFLVCQLLGILDFQIEIEYIFNIVRILISLQ